MNNMLEKLRTVSKFVIEGDRLLSASIGIAEAKGDGEVDDTVVLTSLVLCTRPRQMAGIEPSTSLNSESLPAQTSGTDHRG